MSDTITLDQLKHFWMPSGVPCFIADTKDICDVVESLGFQIYYLISNELKETKETKTTYNSSSSNPSYTTAGNQYGYGATHYGPTTTTTLKQERKPRLFKVVNNFVGRVVSVCDDELPSEFEDIQEECLYTMPLIPYDIVDKLDEFFRLIYSQHGTESIVILTYDSNKTDSSGWGVLVPEQTNTAAHCKYDADSIAAIKPDNVMIVGSVHSHPEMSAYASGTDHQDQADFDGIHITYGWQKGVNNGATQYYAELQMSGKNYKLDIDDVFESRTVQKDPDPEVVEWSTKVKKVLPPHQGGSFHSHPQHSSKKQHNQVGFTPTGTVDGASSDKVGKANENYYSRLLDLGLPKDSILISEVVETSTGGLFCPFCETSIYPAAIRDGRCDLCGMLLAGEDDHMSTICDKVEDYIIEHGIPFSSPIYLLTTDNKGEKMIMKLNEEMNYYMNNFVSSRSHSSVSLPTPDDANDISAGSNLWEDENDDYTVCCGVHKNTVSSDCKCEVTMYYSDILSFEAKMQDTNIYQHGSKCYDCSHFYSPRCPAYKEILQVHIKSINNNIQFPKDIYEHTVGGCSNFISFTSEPRTIEI